MPNNIFPNDGDILLHKKGNYYRVIDSFINDSETLERMVEYQALYGDRKKWVRPHRMFTEDRFTVVIPKYMLEDNSN